MAADSTVGLGDAIEALRAELMDAALRGEGQAMRFALEPIELTVQVTATKEANGKVGWKILKLGGKYEQGTTQTLTLKLAPLWLQEDGNLTHDFAIASQSDSQNHDVVGPHDRG